MECGRIKVVHKRYVGKSARLGGAYQDSLGEADPRFSAYAGGSMRYIKYTIYIFQDTSSTLSSTVFLAI